MKTRHYFLCWLLTLLIGGIVAAFYSVSIGIAMLTVLISGVSSLPFIIFFCIFMHYVLKKNPSKSIIHAYTFGLHAIGALITVAFLGLIDDEFFVEELLLVYIIYFAIDTVLFHFSIEYYSKQNRNIKRDDSLLDDSL